MRIIVKPGRVFKEYHCPFCGQIERLTEEEERICQNCRALLVESVTEEPVTTEAPKVEKEVEFTIAAVKKRPGRPKKVGTCGTCALALVAEKGLTCKETCEGKTKDSVCDINLYKQGTPFGKER